MTQEPNHQKAAEEEIFKLAKSCFVAPATTNAELLLYKLAQALRETESATVRRCLEIAKSPKELALESGGKMAEEIIKRIRKEFNLND